MSHPEVVLEFVDQATIDVFHEHGVTVVRELFTADEVGTGRSPHAYGVPGVNRRRAFSLRFLGDDMVHAPRDWVTSPNFDGLNLEIPAGAPMNHPLFPLLREAATRSM
jgi:hypothetical protein